MTKLAVHIAKVPRRLLRRRDGAAMVEFALLAPLLLSLGLGVTEFGNILQNYHVVDKGVRDAARYLARHAAICSPGALTGSMANSGDVTAAQTLAMTGYTTGTSWKLPYWTDLSTVTVTVSCIDNSDGAYRGEASIPIVTVAASVPYSGFGFLAPLGLPSIILSAQHEEQNLPD